MTSRPVSGRLRPSLCATLILAAGFGPGLAASAALAATVTFDPGRGSYFDLIPDPHDEADTYIEDGVTVTGFIFGQLSDEHPRAHLDNPSDGHFTDALTFRFTPLFDLVSFDLWPLGYECEEDPCDGYDNVVVTGWRGHEVTSSTTFAMGSAPSLFVGGLAFAGLDRLVISTLDGPGSYQFGNTHFEIDNVVLAEAEIMSPVPLPAGLPLLAAGLGALALAAARRKARSGPGMTAGHQP